MHHCRHLHEPCHIAAGAHGYYEMRNLNPQYVYAICLEPRAFLHYTGCPFYKCHHHIYGLLQTDAAHAEELGNIYYAYAATFHISPAQFAAAAQYYFVANALAVHMVVGYERMSVIDESQGAFAFAYAAVSANQSSYTLYVHERPVQGHLWNE